MALREAPEPVRCLQCRMISTSQMLCMPQELLQQLPCLRQDAYLPLPPPPPLLKRALDRKIMRQCGACSAG